MSEHQQVRFQSKLFQPAQKGAAWGFVLLPGDASAALPSRGMVAVTGCINGVDLETTLAPDGKGSHWLKVPESLLQAAELSFGDTVSIELKAAPVQPEVEVPADLRDALRGAPSAWALWQQITPIARRDWVAWVDSAKRQATRERRIRNACEMLAAGKRRVCCFDRSGIYSGAMAAPKAAE